MSEEKEVLPSISIIMLNCALLGTIWYISRPSQDSEQSLIYIFLTLISCKGFTKLSSSVPLWKVTCKEEFGMSAALCALQK